MALLIVLGLGGLAGYGVYRYLDANKGKDGGVAQAPSATSPGAPASRDPKSVREAPVDDRPTPEPLPPREDHNPDSKPDNPAPKPNPRPAPEGGELAPVIARLRSGTQEERVAATDELARMGKKAQPASRALGEMATDPSQKVARAALVALDKINPDLQQPVFVLLIDDSAANHKQALGKLKDMEGKGAAAVPVVLHEIKTCEEQLNDQRSGKGGRPARPWNAPTLSEVIGLNMETLPKIAPEDPQVVKALIEQTKFTPVNRFGFGFGGDADPNFPFRAKAVHLLGEIAERRSEHRNEIIPALVAVLTDAAKHTESAQDFEVLAGIATVDGAGNALLKCGPEAKTTLAKEVLPRLKELQFHKSAQVRQAADALRKKIEGTP
jgi:hypothetical protein